MIVVVDCLEKEFPQHACSTCHVQDSNGVGVVGGRGRLYRSCWGSGGGSSSGPVAAVVILNDLCHYIMGHVVVDRFQLGCRHLIVTKGKPWTHGIKDLLLMLEMLLLL